MAMLPLVFPGIVMGIAILKMYLMLPIPVYGSVWILVLAFIALKMLLSDFIKDFERLHEIMPGITFAVIILCIAGGIIASLLLPPSAAEERELELIEQATRSGTEEQADKDRRGSAS